MGFFYKCKFRENFYGVWIRYRSIRKKNIKKYLTKCAHRVWLKIIDFISDNTDDVLGFLAIKTDLKVNEQYEPVARFLEYIKGT